MRRHTTVGCVGAAVVLAAALLAVQAPARRVQRYQREMSDRLELLAAAQARFRQRAGRYGMTAAEVGLPMDSAGVRLVVSDATDSGWAATASHSATTVVCRVQAGRPRGAGGEAKPRCE